MLLREKKISRELVDKLLSWKNSGFNIHNQVRIQSHDSHGRESLAQYILRSPFSQQKMTYRKDTQTVLYRSKMNPNLSFIDQGAVIKKILQHLGLWEESHSPLDRGFLLRTFSNRPGHNSKAHELCPSRPTLSKPKPRAGPGSKRIDEIVNMAKTPLKRCLIASYKAINLDQSTL